VAKLSTIPSQPSKAAANGLQRGGLKAEEASADRLRRSGWPSTANFSALAES